jgi:glycosyltransferase involved in cell wall biosynthesis
MMKSMAVNVSSSTVEHASAPHTTEAQPALTPVRILHVHSGNMFGGVETILLTLARLRNLCPAMQSDFALCYEGRLSRELRQAGAAVRLLGRVRMSRPWTVWSARRNLRKILREESFDLVICHMPWALAAFGKSVRDEGRRLGFWAHGFHSGRGWVEALAQKSKPDVVIANSAFTKTGVANLFPEVRGEVIYAPVDLQKLPDAELSRASLRRQENVAGGEVVILQVSRMESWKGHELHLEALARLESIPNWTCWIAGGPQKPDEEEYLTRLRQAAARLGIGQRVKFLGQRSDIPQLLGAADIFCQPNLGPEPFGIVFVEALWAERPVVATRIGGAVEIVDESCGLLVEPGNAAVLAESLRSLIENAELRIRLGRAGAERARRLCDGETQLRKVMDLARGTDRNRRGVSL